MVWVTNWCRVYNGNVVNTVFVKKIDKKFFRFINVNICEINEVKCCARPVRLQCDDGSHFFYNRMSVLLQQKQEKPTN